jgi:hypothetical protein
MDNKNLVEEKRKRIYEKYKNDELDLMMKCLVEYSLLPKTSSRPL